MGIVQSGFGLVDRLANLRSPLRYCLLEFAPVPVEGLLQLAAGTLAIATDLAGPRGVRTIRQLGLPEPDEEDRRDDQEDQEEEPFHVIHPLPFPFTPSVSGRRKNRIVGSLRRP
jgi:hypothetical protein